MMRERVALDAPQEAPDGFGGSDVTWAEQFTAHAEFKYAWGRGQEAVEAGKMTGLATFKVRLRSSRQSRAITTDYRLRDMRRNIAFAIREVDAITRPAMGLADGREWRRGSEIAGQEIERGRFR